MIHEVDESLRTFVRRGALPGSDVDVVFDAPTKDWSARRNSPTIDLYLYDIREDPRRREFGTTVERTPDGRPVKHRHPPRWFKLSYLVTAWTQRPEDEHRLLSALLQGFLRCDALPLDVLAGSLRELRLPVSYTCALPPPQDRALSDVWSALGGELKPSLDLVVLAPFDLARDVDLAPAVEQPLGVDMVDTVNGGRDFDRRRTVTSAPIDQREVDRDRRLLLEHFDRLRDRVREAVALRSAGDPDPDDRFRGLYITDEQASGLFDPRPHLPPDTSTDDLAALANTDPSAFALEDEPRLHRLLRNFGLTALDVQLLLVAMGPDLDPRFEPAYGYLHDDVTRRRASVGLALELCGRSFFDPVARIRFDTGSPLVRQGLLVLDDLERPLLSRSLRVPDLITTHLLGGSAMDPLVAGLVTPVCGTIRYDTTSFVNGIRADLRLFYVRDRVGAAALSFAARGALDSRRPSLALDLTRLGPEDDIKRIGTAAIRQALLEDAVLIVGPVEVLAERGAGALRAFTDSRATTVIFGSSTWDPAWADVPPVVVDAPDINGLLLDGLPFRLTPEQVERARDAANRQAAAEGVAVTPAHLAAGARGQNAGGLERLALRVSPSSSWEDLVLPEPVNRQLRELVSRVEHRDRVLAEWGLRRGAARGRGVTALFAGDSGTGKTLTAEVIAKALELDLYVIDLSTVVDKYIGETEKNLDRIFREADRVNGVLLFDEADAIFGKRSEVQDARDRYANVEVAYLLQRMERFDGVAILTTNLRANIDEAFLRRLDTLIDFPLPDVEQRHLLWQRHLPPTIPRDRSVDLEFLAGRFELSGGNIKSIAFSAAFLAAADGNCLTMSALIRSTAREYRKLGRLCVPGEFAPYYELID